MTNILNGLGSAAVSTVGNTVAFAGGTTASHALTPYGVAISQEAFKLAPIRVPDALVLAAAVAQGQVDPEKAAAWATASGFNAEAFQAMVNAANTGPPLGAALELLRRDDWTVEQYHTALHRMGIEQRWWDGLTSLRHERLDLGALATAVHRGIVSDAGLLVTPVPQGEGNVPRIPVSPLDTLAEFAAQGIDPERARVLVADTGLPLALGQMLELWNRNVVTDTDVKVSIAESNVRNEYMDVALALARRLLTPHEYAEAELRGLMDHAEAKHGASLHGLHGDDYDTLYGILGRPLNVHEITTALARGGTYGGTYDDVPEGPYRDAIRRSAVRPEYASMAYANRYTYPSAFVLRSLAQAGDLGDEPAVAKVLEEIGWKPAFAEQVAAAWMSEDAGDRHVSGAQTRLVTAAHKSYIDGELTDADTTVALHAAGVAPASIPAVLAIWRAERDLVRKSLSPAKIVKAWKSQAVNAATGLPWTQPEALAALQDRGYSATEAQDLLNIG